MRHLLLQNLLQIAGVVNRLALLVLLLIELAKRRMQRAVNGRQQCGARAACLLNGMIARPFNGGGELSKSFIQLLANCARSCDYLAAVLLASVLDYLAGAFLGLVHHAVVIAFGGFARSVGLRLSAPLR